MTALAQVVDIATRRPVHASHAPQPAERKAHRQLSAEARARLADEVKGMPAWNKHAYGVLAERYDVSVRTVQSVVAEARRNLEPTAKKLPRARHGLPANALDLVAGLGSMKQAWRLLRAEDKYGGDYTTFTRQMNASCGSNVVRGARRGTAGMNKDVYLAVPAVSFMRRYTIDLFSLRMAVRDAGATVNPTGLYIREDNTDTIILTHVFDSDAVTAAMVANLLGRAFGGLSYEVGGGPVLIGGLPHEVLCDNGAQFSAEELRASLASLGVAVANINSYSSHENGKHERKHGQLRVQLLRGLPGSNDGARDTRGALMDTRDLLDLETLRDLVARWAWAHNNRTGTADELTPLERWTKAAAAAPLRIASAREVAPLALLHPRTCKQYKYGVRLLNRHYMHPDLSRPSSSSFAVGTWLGDPDHVELFNRTGSTWLGRATDNEKRSAAEEQSLLAHRADERDQVVAAHRRANGLNPRHRPDLPAAPTPAAPSLVIPEARQPRSVSLADALEGTELGDDR